MEIKRGDIWYVSKDNYTGCEQAAGRPAIIVSNEKEQRLCRDSRGRIHDNPTEERPADARSHPQL